MWEVLKDAARFALGVTFLVTLIPPAMIIGGIVVVSGYLDRRTPDADD